MIFGVFSFFNALMMVGLSVPSSIAEEEETLTNSDFSYNLLFFRYTLVFISGLSLIQKVYHNFNNIKSANYSRDCS